ncbi:hypothetical protein JCM8202_000845 [Rhodotorula sphaerocarpa]
MAGFSGGIPGEYDYGYGYGSGYDYGASGIGEDYLDYGSRVGDPSLSSGGAGAFGYGDYGDYGMGGYPYGAEYGGGFEDRLWGEGDSYYPELYSYMNFVDRPLAAHDAWGDESWEEEQYYQQQLELDTALSEAQRLRRWEERLAWEELDEEARALRYHELAASGALGALGLAGGFWGRRFGGMDHDLSYLRSVPIARGLFGSPYRSSFARYPTLARRYSPYFSRHRLRAFQHPIGSHTFGNPYESQRISSIAGGVGLGLREQELRNRLRIAELRASLTSLDPTSRAQALDDARRLRAEIDAEARFARGIDRTERRADALFAATEADAERREWRDEVAEQRGLRRLAGAGLGAGILGGQSMPGAFGYGGRF